MVITEQQLSFFRAKPKGRVTEVTEPSLRDTNICYGYVDGTTVSVQPPDTITLSDFHIGSGGLPVYDNVTVYTGEQIKNLRIGRRVYNWQEGSPEQRPRQPLPSRVKALLNGLSKRRV